MSINFCTGLDTSAMDHGEYEDAINLEIKSSLATSKYGICYRYELGELFSGLDTVTKEIAINGDPTRKLHVECDAIRKLIVIAAKHEVA